MQDNKGCLDPSTGNADHRGDGKSTRGGFAMLRKIAGDCSDGVTCPTVWVDDDEGTVIVQGYQVTAADLPAAPDGETRVRLPRAMLLEAARELQ
jgi:hypothetical protein